MFRLPTRSRAGLDGEYSNSSRQQRGQLCRLRHTAVGTSARCRAIGARNPALRRPAGDRASHCSLCRPRDAYPSVRHARRRSWWSHDVRPAPYESTAKLANLRIRAPCHVGARPYRVPGDACIRTRSRSTSSTAKPAPASPPASYPRPATPAGRAARPPACPIVAPRSDLRYAIMCVDAKVRQCSDPSMVVRAGWLPHWWR